MSFQLMKFFDVSGEWEFLKILKLLGYVCTFGCLMFCGRYKIYRKFISGDKKFDSVLVVMFMSLVTIVQILSCIMEYHGYTEASLYGSYIEFGLGSQALWANWYRIFASSGSVFIDTKFGNCCLMIIPICMAVLQSYWRYCMLSLAMINFLITITVILKIVLAKADTNHVKNMLSFFFITLSNTSAIMNSLNVDDSGKIIHFEVSAITTFVNVIRGIIYLVIIYMMEYFE